MALAIGNRYRRRRDPAEPETETDAGQATAGDRRTPRVSRTRLAAGRSAWAAGSMMVVLARLVRLIAGLVVLVIVVGIVLRILSANPANSIVSDIHDAGRALVGPFKNIFTLKNPKADLAVNWGLAAVVYLIVGGLIAGLITRAAPRGLPPSRAAATTV
jgi:hypothetical protein